MPPPTPVARVDRWIETGSFIQAYRALLLGLALLRLVLRLNGEGVDGTAPDDASPT